MSNTVVPVKGQSKPQDEQKVDSAEVIQTIEEMNEDLRNIYTQIQAVINNDSECIIRNKHHLGKLVKDVYENESTKYGSKSIERLSKALGRNPALLYDAKKFIEVFPDNRLEELINFRNQSGHPLMWTHVEALIHVPEDSVREAMLVSVLNDSLTPKELEQKIHQHYGGKRSNSTGRKLARPTTFNGYLDSIISTAEAVTKKCDTVWCGGEKTINDAAEEIVDIDEGIFDKIQKALDELSELESSLEITMIQLSALMDEMAVKFERSKEPMLKVYSADEKDNLDMDNELIDIAENREKEESNMATATKPKTTPRVSIKAKPKAKPKTAKR